MMKRYAAALLVVAIAVLFNAGDAYACRSFVGYPDAANDTTTYKNDLNVDLSDYGVIYEEAAPWSSCTQAAADALHRKLYTTFNPSLVGKPAWPRTSNQIDGSYGPFQGWLSGGDVALIQATALRLANVGKLSKPLDDLVQRVSAGYAFNVDQNCGFDGTVPNYANPPATFIRWTTGNSCMEDYTIGAMGLAWTAAYRVKRGVSLPGDPAGDARAAITDALSTESSICAWDSTQTNVSSPPSRGPCTGSMSDLLNNSNFLPISLHGGDSMPYGVGLFTSIAGATVGLEIAGQTVTLDSTEKAVVQKLYNHARNYTAADHSAFATNCWQFALVDGEMRATDNFNCRDQNTAYHPKMFPIRDFVARYAPPSASNPGFDTFDWNLFCDTSVGNGTWGPCSFYNPGRRSVYGHMAQAWVQNPPIFSNTGLGDYTVTLRTVNGNYLSATNGGGNSVNAAPTAANSYEQFSLMIRTPNDTQLSDGDTVTLQTMTSNNAHWFAAEDGGGAGSVLNANRQYPWTYETFTIHKLNGTGAITSNDTVALESLNGYYVSAMNGGGSTVTVDRTAILTWETFTIGVTHN